MYKTSIRTALEEIFGLDGPVDTKLNKFIDIKNIQELLALKQIKPNKTTIYRQLESLEKSRKLTTSQVKGSQVWSTYEHKNHNHFVCDKCYKIICVHLENTLINQIRKQTSSQFQYSNLRIEGKCLECVS